MISMGPVRTVLLAICNDSDVGVIENENKTLTIEWMRKNSGQINTRVVTDIAEAAILLDAVEASGFKVPYRFIKDLAIKAISELIEGRDDGNLKEE
jgi:hypothetical protein